jgi:hypothetical protein
MFLPPPHRVSQAWPANRWLWLAPALALLGMLLPATGWQSAAQLQNLCLAGSSSDEGENEFPGEDEGGDSADGDLEAHLLFRRASRESLWPALAAETSELLVVTDDSACFPHALPSDRDAAACSAARLPLRC